jgi:hypothetical protein
MEYSDLLGGLDQISNPTCRSNAAALNIDAGADVFQRGQLDAPQMF